MSELRFTSVSEHKPGLILAMLQTTYESIPGAAEKHSNRWADFDRRAFEDPSGFGSTCFVTCLGQEPIGMACWDDSEHPSATIGSNCILPAYQGRGLGRAQLREVLRQLCQQGFKAADTVTGDNDFFLPARRMYEACGFTRLREYPPSANADFGTVDYRLELPG